MALINYHTHTEYCGHAHGSTDDYAESAIRAGLIELGFADHAPIPEPIREGITMKPEDTEPYIRDIFGLRERYRDRLTIRLGFEVDFPLFDTFRRDYFTDPRIDYLIGSCHFLDGWAFDHTDYIEEFEKRDTNSVYARYYEIVTDMVSSKLFNIVGHFDLVKIFGYRATRDFIPEIEKIAGIMADNTISAEINTRGLKKPVQEIYPAPDILKVFFENNVPITISADAHEPDEIDFMLAEAAELARKTGYRRVSGFEQRKRYDLPL